ncbi:MAG: hypothetical protein ACI84C_001400 [Flavobacteriales bacterium]|jgi:hypothetical protein
MKTQKKYDPEDIESLLQHKSFDELYPEERAFVLNHMESPEEYASMRETLLELQAIDWDKDGIEPRKEIKERLMEEFVVQRKGGLIIWLNTLFAQGKSVSWYRSGGFQVAMGVLVLALVGTWFLTSQDNTADMIAEVKQDVEMAPIASDSLESETQISDLKEHLFEKVQVTEDAIVDQTIGDDEDFRNENEDYRAKSKSHEQGSDEPERESFALAAENEIDIANTDVLGDQALFDMPSENIEYLALRGDDSTNEVEVVSVDAVKIAMRKDQSDAVIVEEGKFIDMDDVAYTDETFLDEIQMDNSMGNSVSPTVTLESTSTEATRYFAATDISINEISAIKISEGQSIKKYKGLLDELYTSY